MTQPEPFAIFAEVRKVDAKKGIVFGFGSVCTKGGKPYVDLQREHIPEATMLDFATEFASGERVAKSMHEGEPIGTVMFVYPMTQDIADSLGFTVPQTGMLIGMRPSADVLAKFADGTFTGFSIGGSAVYEEREIEVEEEVV